MVGSIGSIGSNILSSLLGLITGGAGGGTPAPTLTATPTTKSVAANAASGTLLFAIANVPAGVTPSVSPNDGRFAIAGDATNGWKVVIGLSALSAGSVNVAVAAAGATGVQVPVTVTAASGAVAPFAAKSIRTTQDLTTATLAPTAVTAFAAGAGTTGAKEIVIDTSTTYQTWLGLGAALTDASAYVLMTNMTAAQRTAFLTQLFSPTSGLGFNFLRMPMGDSDYTSRNMNGASGTATATGNFQVYVMSQTDDNLQSFSTAIDNAYVDVIYEQIKAINPNIITIRTPWSPPAFYKTNATLVSPTKDTTYFNATAANIASYAQYFVKDQKDFFAKHGRYSEYVALQNEPNASPTTYPGCRMNGNDLMALGVAVRSAFDAAGIPTLILSGDASWGDTTQNGKSLSLYPFQNGAGSSFAGAAYHAYNGGPQLMAEMDAYPGKLRFMTEHSGLNTAAKAGINWLQFMGDDMIGSPYYGANGIMFWNIALDANGQPGQAINLQAVAGIATDGTVTFSPQYYALAHIAAYVKPGAVRVKATTFGTVGSTGSDVQAICFKNLDGSLAPVLFNAGSSAAPVTLKDQQAGNQQISIPLAAKEVRSLTWKNAAAVTVPDQPLIKVTALTATTARVDWVNGPPANGGAAITAIDIWDSTVPGQEAKVASPATLPYILTGLATGPLYVVAYARNTAGPSIASAEASATLVAGTPSHFMQVSGSNSNAYANQSTANNRTAKSRRALIWSNLASYHAAAAGKNLPLTHTWAQGTSSASNAGYMFAFDSSGQPSFLFYTGAGVFGSATIPVSLDTVYDPSTGAGIYKYPVLNLDTNTLATEIMVGGQTVNGANQGGTAFVAPAGSAAFFYSVDGITWTQLGTTVTGLPTTGINAKGACVVGHGGNADTPASGKFYKVVCRDETGIVYSPDFTAQATGITSFVDAQGSTWNINNSTEV